jgi:hypothetical protein
MLVFVEGKRHIRIHRRVVLCFLFVEAGRLRRIPPNPQEFIQGRRHQGIPSALEELLLFVVVKPRLHHFVLILENLYKDEDIQAVFFSFFLGRRSKPPPPHDTDDRRFSGRNTRVRSHSRIFRSILVMAKDWVRRNTCLVRLFVLEKTKEDMSSSINVFE